MVSRLAKQRIFDALELVEWAYSHLFTFFSDASLGTPLVVSAEIFPQHVRPVSLGFVSASNW